MSELQQFIDDFLHGNGDDAINAALGHVPPPEPPIGSRLHPRALAGFQAELSAGEIDGELQSVYREDIRKLLDRWVPWSRHVDIVPPPPGALAVRWSSFEHMRTYARNARAA